MPKDPHRPWETPTTSCDFPFIFDPIVEKWYRIVDGKIRFIYASELEAAGITETRRLVLEAGHLLEYRLFLEYCERIEDRILPGSIVAPRGYLIRIRKRADRKTMDGK